MLFASHNITTSNRGTWLNTTLKSVWMLLFCGLDTDLICHESCCYLTRTGTSKSTIFPIGACIQATFSSSLFTAVLWIALACIFLRWVMVMTYGAYCVVLCLESTALQKIDTSKSVLTCDLIDLWALIPAKWIRVRWLTSAGIASDSLPSSSAILRKNNLLITPLGLYSRICKAEGQLLTWMAWYKGKSWQHRKAFAGSSDNINKKEVNLISFADWSC